MFALVVVYTIFASFGPIKSTMVTPPPVPDTFSQCLLSRSPGTLSYCLGVGAISTLRSIDNDPEFDIADGVTFIREEQHFRDEYNYVESDPGDFRSIIDSMGEVFSRRSLRWDISTLYPGLIMRIAPSASPGGVLEFALDPHRESLAQHNLKEASTGRVLARQFLVPFLLGFKLNIATLIPIVFGLLAIIAKKAVFMSKIALIITSALGLGSLLLGGKYNSHYGAGPFNHGQGLGYYGHYRHPDDDLYTQAVYRENEDQLLNDQVRLHTNVPLQEDYALSREDKKKGRNFAWNEQEKGSKLKAS